MNTKQINAANADELMEQREQSQASFVITMQSAVTAGLGYLYVYAVIIS